LISQKARKAHAKIKAEGKILGSLAGAKSSKLKLSGRKRLI